MVPEQPIEHVLDEVEDYSHEVEIGRASVDFGMVFDPSDPDEWGGLGDDGQGVVEDVGAVEVIEVGEAENDDDYDGDEDSWFNDLPF